MAGLQGPVGDFRNPPLLDPTTGARVGLAAKPGETPKGGYLVAQDPTSDTYALGGGKFLLRAHSRPVNWQDTTGGFHRLDLTLAKGSDGRWRPKDAPPGPSFADTAPAGGSNTGRTVQLDGAGWSVGFDLASGPALSAAVTSDAASYDLGGGASLVEHASPDGGVKEAIRLAGPPSGPGDVSYRFALDLKGVVPSVDPAGLIVFSTPDGTVVASVPAGLAVDSQLPAPAQSPVAVALAGGPGSWTLKVTASGAWLADKARVYPAVIDPSLQFGRGGSTAEHDAFVFNGAPTTNYSGAGQWAPSIANYIDAVGSQGGGLYNTFLKWNLSSLIGTGKGISSATLTMTALGATPSTGTPYAANALSADFAASAVTWNNQPATTGIAEGLSAAANGGQATASLTAEVTGWASGQLPTFSGYADVVVKAREFPPVTGTTDFGAMLATGGVDPLLQVTYTDLPPATIVTPPPSSLQGCQHPDHGAGGCLAVVGTTTPTVTVSQPGNPAGHTISYWYQIADGRSPPNGDFGEIVQSGWIAPLSWIPPPGALADGRTYNLIVTTMIDGVIDQAATSSFTVRLPDRGVTPSDTAGPVSVNLATGSPSLSLGSQAFNTAGGPISLGLDYDPQRAVGGLQGSYYNNCNGTTNPWPTPAITRADPLISFYWGNDGSYGTPVYGAVSPGSYCAQWTGFVTVPYTGTWQLGAVGVGDGVTIAVGATTVLNDWTDHSAVNEYCTGVTSSACNQTLTAGAAYPITIKYYHHLNIGQIQLGAKGPINPDGTSAPGQLNQVAVPAPWLTPPTRALPAGWRLSVPTGASAYTSAAYTATGMSLNQLTGPGLAYSWNSVNGNYQPPEGETAATRWVTEGGARVLKVADGDITYTFDITGKLLATVTGADLSAPTSPAYTFDPTGGQLTAVTDPVSARQLGVTYGTRSGGSDPNCHVTATGFDPDPPVGMLCKITLPGGSTDRLYYTAGQLSRLVTSIPSGSTNPFEGNITDMGYDAQSRLVSAREPLASDQVAAGLAAADATSATTLAYDPSSGKVTSLTAPKAQAGATSQVTHTYSYTSPTETRAHVAGFTEPTGAPWARKVAFDSNGRLTADTDPAGLTTTTSYDTLDQPIVVTTPAGMRTSTFYNPQGRPTDRYGPAATALYDTTDHPATGNTARVPHTVTGYDEGLHGLAVEYYSASTDLAGPPAARGLAIGKGGNDFYNSYPASPAPGVAATNWSARYTGTITWPVTGAYNLNLASAGGARLYLDGFLIDDGWLPAHGPAWTNATAGQSETAGTTSRVQIDYYNTTYNPGLVQLAWTGAQNGDIPTSALSPDLGVVTSTTDADGHKTATEYARPEIGTVSASVVDPAGLALRTTHASDTLLRPTGMRLPANSEAQAVRADGPAGYWRLDDHTYETVTDASGHNLGGSYSGPGVTLAQPGALKADDNPAATFNGTTGTATIADNTTLRKDRTQSFSVEAWVNTAATGTIAIASKMANTAPFQGWEVGLTAGKPYLMLTNTWATNTIYRVGSVNLADSQWHHLVVTYDGSSQATGVNFYQDGTIDTAPTTTFDNLTATTVSTAPLTIGSRASAAWWLPGAIDDVAVYPTALPAARIAIHATAGRSDTAAVNTTYYGAALTNTCTGVAVVGLPKQTTDADPDGTGPIQPIVHQAVYDLLGRVAGSQTLGDANWSCTTYDARGRAATRSDSAGHQTSNSYNDTTSPGTISQTAIDSAGATRTTAAVTDLLGRANSYTDEQAGTTTTNYDQAGRLTDTYHAIFGGGQSHLTSTTYDTVGRPSATSEYLSGTARTTTISYDAVGRPSAATMPNGIITTPGYDADRGLLSGLTNVTAGGTHLSDWTYHQTLGAKIDTDTNTGVRTRNYTYDQAGRLTKTVEGATTRRYAYDANTNRCALATTCDGTWTANIADQLIASPQATGYTYNSHGGLIAASRTDGRMENISYDANDHATTVDNGTSTIAETIAAGGRVLERKVTNDSTQVVVEDTLYGYGDAGDSPTYTRAAGGGGVTTYIGRCVDVSGSASWEIQNAHSDTVGMTDANGVYTPSPSVDEFGVGAAPTSRLGYLGGKERFTTDTVLGLIRMGVRLFDPTLGLFLETDPVPGSSANSYDYVNADPVNATDTTGMSEVGGDLGSVEGYVAPSGRVVAPRWSDRSNGVFQYVPRHKAHHSFWSSAAHFGTNIGISFLTGAALLECGITVVCAVAVAAGGVALGIGSHMAVSDVTHDGHSWDYATRQSAASTFGGMMCPGCLNNVAFGGGEGSRMLYFVGWGYAHAIGQYISNYP